MDGDFQSFRLVLETEMRVKGAHLFLGRPRSGGGEPTGRFKNTHGGKRRFCYSPPEKPEKIGNIEVVVSRHEKKNHY